MRTFEARVQKLESMRPVAAPMTLDASLSWLGAEAARRGLSESDVVQLHGGLPGFAHWLMSEPRSSADCQPNDGLSAQERYMRMLRGPT